MPTSGQSGNPTVKARNNTHAHVHCLWVNGEEEVNYGTVQPGAFWSCSTFTNLSLN